MNIPRGRDRKRQVFKVRMAGLPKGSFGVSGHCCQERTSGKIPTQDASSIPEVLLKDRLAAQNRLHKRESYDRGSDQL